MITKVFSYNISKTASSKAFKNVCSVIESKMEEIQKEDMLTDCDGSQIQIYNTEKGKIKVYNDYEVDAVYVDSEVELKMFSGSSL